MRKKMEFYKRRTGMITDSQTNAVYFSSLLPAKCPELNAHITEALRKRGVPFGYLSETRDIWCRDYMPIQVDKDHLVSYNYTPDYLKGHLRLQTDPEIVLQADANELFRHLPTSRKE
jgi:agmatine deiminase